MRQVNKIIQDFTKNILMLSESKNDNIRKMVAVAIRDFEIKDGTAQILMSYLTDKNPNIRFEAAKSLRYVAPKNGAANSVFAKRLGVNPQDLRQTVVAILSGKDPNKDKKNEDIAKKEPIPQIRNELARSAAWLDESLVIEPLLSYLASSNPQSKIAGAVGLGNIEYPETLSALEKVALNKEEDVTVRKSAIVSIGKIGHISSTETLKGLTGDKSDEIRKEAIIALNHIKPEDGDKIYLDFLTDGSHSVREVACIALGNTNMREHLGTIASMLDDPHPVVRKAAASVLGSWRDVSVAQYLMNHITEDADECLNEIALSYMKILRPEGRLIVDFNEENDNN